MVPLWGKEVFDSLDSIKNQTVAEEAGVEATSSLIEEIVELELEMFLAVQARGHAPCQDNPDQFRAFRKANFSCWPEDALRSYLDDLQQAKLSGKNLLTLKYARMEGIIPPLLDTDLLDAIVEIETSWVRELASQYPLIHGTCRPLEEDSSFSTSFATYLRGELETMSERTLSLYHRHQLTCREHQTNLAATRLKTTLLAKGFQSLEDAEEYLARRQNASSP